MVVVAFLCVSLLVDRVLASLLFFRPGPGFCRRPGRGINTGISGGRRPGRGKSTGLAQLASHEDLSGQIFCWFVLTASAPLCVCWRVP